MKVYIFADLEGVACVFSRRENYIYAAEYGTLELVAICDKLNELGAGEILINSPHILEYHKFQDNVKIFRAEPCPNFFTEGLTQDFDFAMITGMHAMAGGLELGCWRHSLLPHPVSQAYSAVECVWLNDMPVGEIGLFTAFAGILGIPVIMLTGDFYACKEAETLIPDIYTLAVKKGCSFYSAVSMTPGAAAKASAELAGKAALNHSSIKPYIIKGPVTLKVRYLFAERAADAIMAVPDAIRVDEKTVELRCEDLKALIPRFGSMRAIDNDIYREDLKGAFTTGFFTRIGPEPFESSPTYKAPVQKDFALGNWGR